MAYYAIGIGGTGAKCIESLTHLASAGLMPSNQKLFVMFVDPDKSNGSLGRAGEILKCYTDCRNNKPVDTDFLRTRIEIAEPNVWTPLTDGTNRLDSFFGYNTLSDESKHVFDVLYSPEERTTLLDKGFRGHPSIGAAVLAAGVNIDDDEPWQTFWEKIESDLGKGENVKIILFGSIFGGTGASGIPTIARLLQNRFEDYPESEKIFIASVLGLPYFSFERGKTDEMKADSHDFLLNTKAALEYYQNKDELGTFDFTYLIGCEKPNNTRTSELGGQNQKNDPHFVELYSGLAAIEFFRKESEDVSQRYNLIARDSDTTIKWADLPFTHHSELETRILQLVRFSFAYLSTFYPMIVDINTNGSSYRAPWYVDFFEFKKIDINVRLKNELRHVNRYCLSFLEWFANIEYSITGESTAATHLFNTTSFAYVEKDENGKDRVFLRDPDKFSIGNFENILLPGLSSTDSGMAKLWSRMCEVYPSADEQSAWDFLNHLYRQCGKLDKGANRKNG